MSFDREEARRRAMLVFWKHGYEATSLNDLTSALGVPPSSIYTAFGDKKGLFLEAVDCYLSGPVTSQSIIDGAADGRKAAWGLLQAAAIGFTGEETPAGCLLANAAISCSDKAQDVKEALAAIRGGIEKHLREKIENSVAADVLPNGAGAEALAAHTMAVIQGLSILARDGADRAKLLRVAETAMLVWPKTRLKKQGPT